jgi:hypothetical protein
MQQIKQFLQGKKTYFSAALIALVSCIAWWIHVIGYTEALSLLGVAGGMAGLGAKSQRTAETILAVLGDIQQAQAKIPPGQKLDTKQLAADLGKAVLANFAQTGAMRSTPAGAVSNVVPLPAETLLPTDLKPATCVFCGLAVTANGGLCDSPRNDSAPMGSGKRFHIFMTVNGSAAK